MESSTRGLASTDFPVTHNHSLFLDNLFYDDWNDTGLYGFGNASVSTNDSFPVRDPYPAGYPSGYTWLHIILVALFVTIVIILIICGNTLVCIAIATDRNLKSTQNWFIASLAVADMLLGLLIMPFSLANELMGYWYFGQVWCELWKAIDVLLCTASINSLCLISLDRYWSITRAIHYARQRTPKRAAIMITTVWIISAIICLPPLIGWRNPQPNADFPMCLLSDDIGYVLYSSIGSFYIPMFIMVFVYARVYMVAMKRARKNVKKEKKKTAENGKSSSTTTTSFTNTPRIDTADVSVIPEAEGSSAISEADESGFTTYNPQSGRFEALNHIDKSKHIHITDENRQLLSQDTDTSVNSLAKPRMTSDSTSELSFTTDGMQVPMNPLKHVRLVQDTDSSTDNAAKVYRQRQSHNKPEEAEHSKPLLQPESDSTTTAQNESPKHRVRIIETPTTIVLNSSDHLCSNDHEIEIDEPSGKLSPSEIAPSGGQGRPKIERTSSTTSDKPNLLSLTNFKGLGNLFQKHSSTDPGQRSQHHQQEQQQKTKREQGFRTQAQREHEKQKRKLAKARERRATIVVGIVMAAFIMCWLPFFTLYVSSALCWTKCVPDFAFAFFFWLGYCNSAFNPFIYTIFNREFRQAFHKIVTGRTSRI